MKRTIGTLGFLALCFCATVSWSQSPEEGFFDRSEEGWFWYKAEPDEEELEPEPEITVPQVVISTPEQTEPQVESAPEFPLRLNAAWLRENMPRYLDAAMDDPTLENVEAYLMLQRIAMDRSQTFAEVSQVVTVGNPNLDELARRPSASFATQHLDRIAGRKREKLLRSLTEKVGFFYFFQSDCELCYTQDSIMNLIEDNMGFSVLRISLDGKPIPGLQPRPFNPDDGHAEMLGVQVLPAVFLVSDEGEFAPIGQGAMALPQIYQRVLIASLKAGWITNEQFNETRPLTDLANNLADRLGIDGQPIEGMPTVSGDEFVPPKELLKALKSNLQRGGQ
ncbi:conjugal transfer protein TraF [Pseudovibrio ascidiaceicola]|uniref:conjugal transfer protein TraF n=1 Tax=Pseudovibrio ascidiaceicola TaxID=285279 RepID=UPI0006D26619